MKPPINLAVGQLCDVRIPRRDFVLKALGAHKPLMRLVTKTEWREEDGGLWFYWHWKAQPDAECPYDCGYAGIRMKKAPTKKAKP